MESLRTYKEGIALITGAGSGLGRALALELARRGASLYLSTDRDTKGLEQTAALARSAGGSVHTDCVDVRDAAAVREWVLAPARVDYLFNNAGIVGVGGLTDRYAPSDWDKIIDVNLKGVVNGVHAGYSVMVRQGFRTHGQHSLRGAGDADAACAAYGREARRRRPLEDPADRGRD